MSATELRPKQKKFCLEYLKDLNGTQAAIRAGYAKGSADVHATRMLGKDSFQEYIAKLQSKRAERTEVTVDQVVTELRRLALGGGAEKEVNQVKCLELLGKHLAMFTDNLRHSGDKELMDILRDIGSGK